MVRGARLHPDLVRTSGLKVEFEEGEGSAAKGAVSDRYIGERGVLRPGTRRPNHPDRVRRLVLHKFVNPPPRHTDGAVNPGEIGPREGTFLQRGGEAARRFGPLRYDHDPGGVAIEAVDKPNVVASEIGA